MMPPEIELRIDELVLHGFAAGDRRRIGLAVERELGRLLAAAAAGSARPDGLTMDGAVAFRDGGTVQLSAGASPEVTGAQVAQAVYRALAGARGPGGQIRTATPHIPGSTGPASRAGGGKR